MKSLFKNMIRPLYQYIKDKNQREFYKLYDKWGTYPRFKEEKNVRFLNYIFDVPDLPSFIWQFKEIFVDEIYNFETIETEPVIYDCGANIGMSIIHFKKLYPNSRIKAFEADPIIKGYLQNNLKRNNINDVEVINSAAWIDYNGVEFSIEGADGGSIYGNANKIKVPSIRLKDFIEKEIRIDMLKVDIEGSEYEVLNDCKDSLSCVKNIFIEYHSWNNNNQRLSEILSILENNGFRYYIENVTKRTCPFINRAEQNPMDLQLNIFGYKK